MMETNLVKVQAVSSKIDKALHYNMASPVIGCAASSKLVKLPQD
jgi:hypothetical protein